MGFAMNSEGVLMRPLQRCLVLSLTARLLGRVFRNDLSSVTRVIHPFVSTDPLHVGRSVVLECQPLGPPIFRQNEDRPIDRNGDSDAHFPSLSARSSASSVGCRQTPQSFRIMGASAAAPSEEGAKTRVGEPDTSGFCERTTILGLETPRLKGCVGCRVARRTNADCPAQDDCPPSRDLAQRVGCGQGIVVSGRSRRTTLRDRRHRMRRAIHGGAHAETANRIGHHRPLHCEALRSRTRTNAKRRTEPRTLHALLAACCRKGG